MPIVYILKSDTGKYYIGSTTNIDSRIKHHKNGHTPSTKRLGRQLEVVFQQDFKTLSKARKVEYWLKRQKSKDLIEKIIKDGIIRKEFE